MTFACRLLSLLGFFNSITPLEKYFWLRLFVNVHRLLFEGGFFFSLCPYLLLPRFMDASTPSGFAHHHVYRSLKKSVVILCRRYSHYKDWSSLVRSCYFIMK